MADYTRWHDTWLDLPSLDTPASADFLMHIETGVFTAQARADAAYALAQLAGPGGILDDDYGDVTVAGSGAAWTVNATHAGTTHAAVQSAAEATAATDATTKANAASAFAVQRGNHTGTQTIATVSGLQAALDAKYTAGGTDVAVADGGTGASTAAAGLANLGGAPTVSPTFTGTAPVIPDATAATHAVNRQFADVRYHLASVDMLTQSEFDAFDDITQGTNITISGGVVSIEAVFAARAIASTVVASASETVNNSSALQNDDALVIAVSASAVYEVSALIIYEAAAAADFKIGWTHTGAGTWTMDWVGNGLGVGIAAAAIVGSITKDHNLITDTASFGGSGAGLKVTAQPYGILVTDATAGNLQLQFAQDVANVSDAIRHIGSRLILRRIV